jgi:hypothetical protein
MVRDPQARNNLLKEIQRRIIDDMGYVSICGSNTLWAAWPHLKGFNPNATINDPQGTYVLDLWIDK